MSSKKKKNPEAVIECIKRKATSLFSKKDREQVFKATQICHDIISNASHLLKAFCLFKFEQGQTDPFVELDATLLGICVNVIQGDKVQVKRNRIPKEKEILDEKKAKAALKRKEKKQQEKDEKGVLYGEVSKFFTDHCSTIIPTVSSKGASLSHILNYSIEMLVTNIKNNIWIHFPKYIKKYILCSLIQSDPTFDPETKKSLKAYRKMAWKYSNIILYGEEQAQGDEKEKDHENNMPELPLPPVSAFQHLVPQVKDPSKPRLYDMKSRPFKYLPIMIQINRELETTLSEGDKVPAKSRKLFSPISLTSTFIPNSIRLDTSGLAQLLMDKERIEDFVNHYELLTGIRLKMKSKADMLSSYSILSDIKSPTALQEAQYATELWKYICSFKNYKDILRHERKNKPDKETWVFDNAITTDGYSVNFQITREELSCRKKRFQPKKNETIEKNKERGKKDTTSENSEFMNASDPEFKTLWASLPTEQKSRSKVLSVDPGKVDLVGITDGVQYIRYTRGQRDQHTFKKKRMEESLRRRKKNKVSGTFKCVSNDPQHTTEEQVIKDPTVHDFESLYMSETCKKSCLLKNFLEYWQRRCQMKSDMYLKAYFRNAKFTVHCKTKSSEDIFANRVVNVFLKKTEKNPKQSHNQIPTWMRDSKDPFVKWTLQNHNVADCTVSDLWCSYGNWGKTPNILKGSPPTPGIGLRRRLHEKLGKKTITTCEKYTSQMNPCDQTRSQENPPVGRVTHVSRHHLQRCDNVNSPCRWWNRNVVGSFNILRRFVTESLYPTELELKKALNEIEAANKKIKASFVIVKPRTTGKVPELTSFIGSIRPINGCPKPLKHTL